MASITSTYKDPSDSFVWWIEGDRIAIATAKGDADTTETGEGRLKASQLGVTAKYVADGETANTPNGAWNSYTPVVDTDYGDTFTAGERLKVNDEIMLIASVDTDNEELTVKRGYFNTTAAAHADDDTLSTVNYIDGGIAISYYAEPDKIDNSSGAGISATIDLENVLQPALIDYVKAKALMDAAASAKEPNMAQIKMASAQQCMKNYQEAIRRYGMKKNDKTGGTRAVVPADLR